MIYSSKVETIVAGRKIVSSDRTDGDDESKPMIVRVSAWPVRVGATPTTETKRYVFSSNWLGRLSSLPTVTK